MNFKDDKGIRQVRLFLSLRVRRSNRFSLYELLVLIVSSDNV